MKLQGNRASKRYTDKGLGHAMGLIAHAGSTGMGGGHDSRTKETGGDLFDRTGTGAEHSAGTGMGMGRCCIYADEDEGWCDEWDGKCYWVDEERSAEVKSKVRNMVVKKNSKKKADVAKEENGERLIQ